MKEFCRSDSERGSLSSLDIDVRPAEYSTRDSVTSLHYRSLQNQVLPMSVADVPIRPKHLQCTADVPSRKRFHTAPREKHRVWRFSVIIVFYCCILARTRNFETRIILCAYIIVYIFFCFVFLVLLDYHIVHHSVMTRGIAIKLFKLITSEISTDHVYVRLRFSFYVK